MWTRARQLVQWGLHGTQAKYRFLSMSDAKSTVLAAQADSADGGVVDEVPVHEADPGSARIGLTNGRYFSETMYASRGTV